MNLKNTPIVKHLLTFSQGKEPLTFANNPALREDLLKFMAI